MSNRAVVAAINKMEAWLIDPDWQPDPEALAQWNAEFRIALDLADKGSGWLDLLTNAHAVGRQLEVRLAHFTEVRDGLRAELEAQDLGNRALKGYGAVTR